MSMNKSYYEYKLINGCNIFWFVLSIYKYSI